MHKEATMSREKRYLIFERLLTKEDLIEIME